MQHEAAPTRRHVIFSGANERAILAICRSFAARGVPCSLIGRPGPDPMRLTRYRRWIKVVRGDDRLLVDDMVACVARLAGMHPGEVLVFMPTAESINRMVLENRARFESAGLTVPLVDMEAYCQLSDKAALLEQASRFGLVAPPRLAQATETALPLVAKPHAEFAPDGRKLYPELILDRAALAAFNHRGDTGLYFYQRYIDGASYYYLAHFDADGHATFLYQRNLLQQANGKSILAAELCACPDEEVRDRLVALFNSLGYRGYAMVETMERDGRHYLIEVNPRFWGPWALAGEAGFPPEAFAGAPIPHPSPRGNTRYLWLGGYLANRARRRPIRVYPAGRGLGLRDWLRLLRRDIHLHLDSFPLFLHEAATALRARLSSPPVTTG
jgi:Predicted ATP-grasp enzyme